VYKGGGTIRHIDPPLSMSATEALSGLGSDVAFSISFTIATELRDGALASGWRLEELILTVFAVAVLLSVIPSALTRIVTFFETNTTSEPSQKTLLTFMTLLVEMAQRIAITLAIQLVANTAISHEPLRAVRVLTLFSVAVFFLFLQNGSLNTVQFKV